MSTNVKNILAKNKQSILVWGGQWKQSQMFFIHQFGIQNNVSVTLFNPISKKSYSRVSTKKKSKECLN